MTHFFSTPSEARLEALYYADNLLPYRYWGILFVVAGILASVSSRWPPVSETWGYTVMTGLSSAWSTFFLAGVLLHESDPVNLTAALIWGLVAFLWWAISGLVNPRSSIAVAQNENRAHHAENVELHKELDRVKGE
jgi:hypothetical protein